MNSPKGSLTAVLLCSVLASACVAPTPYAPADNDFGYTSQPLDSSHYRVRFSGNSVTPRDTVEDYLLLRAAEVTLETGNDYFVVVDKDIEREVTYRGFNHGFHHGFHHGFRHGFHHFGGFGHFHPFFGGSSFSAYPVDSYDAFATIAVFKGEKPENDPDAYDARAIAERLRPKAQAPDGEAVRVGPDEGARAAGETS